MAKKSTNKRVFEVARELGVPSKVVVAKCEAEGIPGVTNHMSAVSVGLEATIHQWFADGGGVATAVETAAPVDVEKAKSKVRKKTAKKSAAKTAKKAASKKKTAAKKKDADEEKPKRIRIKVDRPDRAASTPTPVEAPVDDAMETPEVAPVIDAPPAADTPSIAAETPIDDAPPAADAPTESDDAATPVMNVPDRPDAVAPAGPQLETPKKTTLSGPKIIRVEQPDILPAPRSRGGGGGGGRAPGGRGVGGMPTDGGGPTRAPGRDGGASRRNKRRSGAASDGRTGRLKPSDEVAGFNWRKQDLLERERRLSRSGGFFRAARRDNQKRNTRTHQATTPAEQGGTVQISEPITIKELSAATGVKVNDILKKLLLAGSPATINSVLDKDTATEMMLEYDIELEVTEVKTAEEQIAEQFEERDMVNEQPRSPVVTILGHVDHGKTTLLDTIRKANVAAGEAGGITQATSAFRVPVDVGDQEHTITFIDTPGHEAFTEMRSRGAKVTDIVVLVVAADDGVMPQTIESINHAKAADVPIIVALNKVDKAEATDANIQRILGQLAEHELNPTEWGGSTEVMRISALKGEGIQDLLEILDYQTQLLDLSADFGGNAEGTVIESQVEEGRGAVARILIQQGQLSQGDFIVAGRAYGRVRDIVNDRGQKVKEAGPSHPVAISGIDEVPDAGDKFYIVKSLRDAEGAASERRDADRQRDLAQEKVTLDNIFDKLSEAGRKELPLIVKADVQGSLETLKATLGKISGEEVTVSIKHSAVGGINESDVSLAEATGAIILGFNVTAGGGTRRLAENRNVDIRFYDVIYDLTDDVTRAAEGLLEPELKLEVLGHAEVREVFRISKVGMIAGCYVSDGTVERDAQIRVTRDDIVIEKDRRLKQLKRFKDDAKEVKAGQECGMLIEGYDDIKVGDVIECYKTLEVRRSLSTS